MEPGLQLAKPSSGWQSPQPRTQNQPRLAGTHLSRAGTRPGWLLQHRSPTSPNLSNQCPKPDARSLSLVSSKALVPAAVWAYLIHHQVVVTLVPIAILHKGEAQEGSVRGARQNELYPCRQLPTPSLRAFGCFHISLQDFCTLGLAAMPLHPHTHSAALTSCPAGSLSSRFRFSPAPPVRSLVGGLSRGDAETL